MNEVSKRWIEAGRILGEDAGAKVKCPECGVGYLYTKDEAVTLGDNSKIERWMLCDNCGKWNTLLLTIE